MPPMAEQAQSGAVTRDRIADSAVLPIGSRVNELGHLEVGGCDLLEVVEEHGTPAYIYAEDDLRARARAYARRSRAAGRGRDPLRLEGLPGHRAYKLFAEEGLSVDVASGGELHIALAAGFDPARIHMHGNNKTDEEILMAARAGIGHLILDSFDEIERCERLLDAPMQVLIRVTRGSSPRPTTTSPPASSTRSSASGWVTATGRRGRSSASSPPTSSTWSGCTPHRVADLRARALPPGDRRARRAGGRLVQGRRRRWRPRRRLHRRRCAARDRRLRRRQGGGRAGGLRQRREDDDRAGALAGRQRRRHRLPGRHGEGDPGIRTYIAVDGGMSDNLRPMLYGSKYEALIADRVGDPADTLVTVAGMHCESGDVLVRDAMLAGPAVGDVLVTPATGAYGHAMANNYNGVTRPPVIFCRDGEARVVVRRETFDDLTARDV